MSKSVSLIKSKALAIRVIKLYQYLSVTKKEFILSKQLLRCGTSIGALLREAEHAQSKADFLNKVNVALKEANELVYWLELLVETNYISQQEFESINTDSIEILKLLSSTVKTTKLNLGRN